MSAWNPNAIHLAALPPCHIMCHFRVINGKLNCSVFQRSADVGLGVPFNIASYALLTNLIANTCDLQLGELVLMMSDVHIYENHIDAMKIQVERMPFKLPKLIIRQKDIFKCTFEDLEIVDYKHHPHLPMKMAI